MSDRLLLFNLVTDVDDPILGFTTAWINRLAANFAHIDVITMRSGSLMVADNVQVYSVGKERGWSEPRRALEFYRLLAGLLVRNRYVACFAHMMPLFAAMGGPLLKLRGVPLTLWYTHRQVSRVLETATLMSDRVVTASPDSFPLKTGKLRVLGHGIDTDFFDLRSSQASPVNPLTSPYETHPTRPKMTRTQEMVIVSGGYVVQVARLMPIKHQETLVRAIEKLSDVRVVLVGGRPEGGGEYEHHLRGLAHGLDLGGRLVFAGSQPPEIVREHYRRALIAVNLSPVGLFDKAALESMAMELPTIVASNGFDPLLGEYVDRLRVESPEDVEGLASRLRYLLETSSQERDQIGAALRARVVEAHGLQRLIERLVSVLRTGEP